MNQRGEVLWTLAAVGALVAVLIGVSVHLDKRPSTPSRPATPTSEVEPQPVQRVKKAGNPDPGPVVDDSTFKTAAARKEVAGVFERVVELSHDEGRFLFGAVSISPEDGHLIVAVTPRFVAMAPDQQSLAMRSAYEPWMKAKFVKYYKWSAKVEFLGPEGWRRTWPQ
jgi:hypothetical protein